MDEREIWDDLVGDAWVRYADQIDVHSAPFGVAAMDALGDLTGATVLDVGCGTGSTTRALADRVGASGRVTGIDLSERMIEHARTLTEDRPQVAFVAGDVLDLTIAPPVDAVFSRCGVMFFADAIAAFTHLRALTASRGRIAFSAWQDPFTNPWMLVPVIASASVLGPPELPEPGMPGPFSLGDPDVINPTLIHAGWSNIEVTALSVELPFLSGDAREAATMSIEINPLLAAGLHRMPERREELVDAIADALRPHEQDGVVVLQAAASIVTATA